MAETECHFCQKVAGLRDLSPDELVCVLPQSLVLLGPWQHYLGYCIVVSRQHATELSQLSDTHRAAYLDEMCRVARAIEEEFQPRKLNCELLGNLVPHLHWHLFPRYAHDAEALKPVWLALDRAERDSAERARLQDGGLPRLAIADRLRTRLSHST